MEVHIQERATRQFIGHVPILPVVSIDVGADSMEVRRPHFPVLSCGQAFVGMPVGGPCPDAHAHVEKLVRSLDGRGDFLGLGQIPAKRLFGIDMLSCCQCRQDQILVPRRGNANVNHVNLWILDQLKTRLVLLDVCEIQRDRIVIVSDVPFTAEILPVSLNGSDACNGDNLCIWNAIAVNPEMQRSHKSQTNDSDFDLDIICSSFLVSTNDLLGLP